MSLTIHLYYRGEGEAARNFAREMEARGIAPAIRATRGNLQYEYFQPLDDPSTLLLIDAWEDQAALDAHHASPRMAEIAALREKYDLHMTVERYVPADDGVDDSRFIRD